LAIEKVAKEIGFTHISVSSVLSPQIKMVARGMSSSADAYLTPILKAYLESFFKGFEAGLGEGNGARVEFMTSEG
jgi:5-oxoprolinase (ATP-hydrolysing)